jgi:hypothetical protein
LPERLLRHQVNNPEKESNEKNNTR